MPETPTKKLNITTIDLADGAKYILPVRPLSIARFAGLFSMGFGVLFSGFAVFWMLMAAQNIGSDPIGFFFILFGLPFFFFGLFPFFKGLSILVGHNQITVTNGKLRASECVGPFRWTRVRSVDVVEKLEITKGIRRRTNTSSSRSDKTIKLMIDGSNLGTLRALGAKMKSPLVLAWGYPEEALEQLAEDVAKRCGAVGPARMFDDDDRKIEIVETSTNLDRLMARMRGEEVSEEVDEPSDDGNLEQPTGSQVIVEANDVGATINIPPAGIWRGSKGLMSFGIFWTIFVGIITVTLAVSAINDSSSLEIIPFFILIPFWGVGVGMIVAGINMGKRKAILDIVGDTLLITRQNIFGTKQHEWTRDQITSIRVGPSGMEVNKKPVLNLQIHTLKTDAKSDKDTEKLGLFAGRDEDELRWLAAVLRQQLHM